MKKKVAAPKAKPKRATKPTLPAIEYKKRDKISLNDLIKLDACYDAVEWWKKYVGKKPIPMTTDAFAAPFARPAAGVEFQFAWAAWLFITLSDKLLDQIDLNDDRYHREAMRMKHVFNGFIREMTKAERENDLSGVGIKKRSEAAAAACMALVVAYYAF